MREKNASSGELISALLDGEVAASELPLAVDAAAHPQHGLVVWQSYQLVGEILRGNPAAPAADGGLFLARLRARLAEEAPGRPALPVREPATVPVASPVQPDSANDAVVRWKLLAGVASLAAVASLDDDDRWVGRWVGECCVRVAA